MENCDDYLEKFEILSGWQIILIMYYFMNIYNAISSDVSMHSNRLRFLPPLRIVVLFSPESELHCDQFQYLWMYISGV